MAYVSADSTTVDELVAEFKADTDYTEVGYCDGTLGGLTFGYAVYSETDSDGTYYGVDYFTQVNGQLVELCFFMESTTYMQNAATILNTLRYNGTSAQTSVSVATAAPVATFAPAASSGRVTLGSSRVSIELPSGMTSDTLTSDDIAEDMVGYWYNNTLDMAAYVYAADGATVESIDAELGEDSDYTQHGITTVQSTGMTFAYGVSTLTEDGETYTCIDYITIVDNQAIQLSFYMTPDNASAASATAAQIVETCGPAAGSD